MWFIFPQLAGLGHSPMARRYAIRDLDQAARYLADPVLGSRLRHDVRLATSHNGKSALEILGSPDDLKFRSCLTLFAAAASDDSDCLLFKQALDQIYGGEPDPRTLELLSSTSPGTPRLEDDTKSKLHHQARSVLAEIEVASTGTTKDPIL